MTASGGCLNFDGAADGPWSVPIATIGGLPIAAIDRTTSAQLMIDVALSRRGTGSLLSLSVPRMGKSYRCARVNRAFAICSSIPISFMRTACRWFLYRASLAKRRSPSAFAPQTFSTMLPRSLCSAACVSFSSARPNLQSTLPRGAFGPFIPTWTLSAALRVSAPGR